MRKLGWIIALLALTIVFPLSSASAAKVEARISLSDQRMTVYVDGKRQHSWAVSTGKEGYRTPTGKFRPRSLKKVHYSNRFNNAYMPNSIFFFFGYAIHGTSATGKLGSPVSHGCVRLAPGNAAKLFNLVKANRSNTRIVVTR